MARPGTKNQSSGKTRWIKMKIDLTKLKKEWFFTSEKGSVYADITLAMKPDGEVDQYGNLGMIIQDVPQAIYKEDKTVKGPILGNGAELDWGAGVGERVNPGEETGTAYTPSSDDDLPF